ncbi:FAD-binding oxidoreductase [Asticcacaulis sp. YBE204]|uniref:NAD(P)/FAD-dependent oxidoreductase n=1 Tax=Asticcacaulis sp. YBE204 TaxID=1282363 RepID=UPI0003C4051E|nr:FAD-dependent oxidoreductase [Asticcacaulis sp. YBE204]ESQ77363.1 hypothetical protein AEYBE204_17710 [Asticcacaulis sp. YBE204]
MNTAKNLRTGEPVWLSHPVPRLGTGALKRDRKTDIVIIGAGVTGAMAAEALTAEGFSVIMLDRRPPLKGSTAATTALLQYEIDNPLTELIQQIGHDKACRAWRRSKLALDSLAARVELLGIPCAMKRTASLYLSGNVLDPGALKREGEMRRTIGLPNHYVTRKGLRDHFGINRDAAILTAQNLTVQPLRMAAGFHRAAMQRGAEILCPVEVETVETHRDGVTLRTKGGPVIEARYLIYATGYETPAAIRQSRHSIHSTYAIATKPQPDKLWPERVMIWEASDPYLYMRTTSDGRVICGGEDEAFSDEDHRDSLLPEKTKRLEEKLKTLFPQLDSRADFAWCGSFGTSVTGLPTIGAVPGMNNVFAILAYGGNGITFSRLAAEILSAELSGREDPDAELFRF